MFMKRKRRAFAAIPAAAAGLLLVLAGCVAAPSDQTASTPESPGTLVVGMTTVDIPNLDTGLSLNQGAEGMRFVGLSLYDGLTKWDLSDGGSLPTVVPGLAESWEANDDATEWTFFLREGVSFTDGTPWNAEAAAFNINRYVDEESPQYFPELNATAGIYVGGMVRAEVVDDMTIKILARGPQAALPESLATIPMGSPSAIEELGNEGFAAAPVGTGPFVFERMSRGQELVLTANEGHWNGAPEVETLILRPLPDATSRVAALRSGEVDWIESPTPDDVVALSGAGFQAYTNTYDHAWVWMFDTTKGPLADPLVRQAANYAIDRESLAETILQGTAEPLRQLAPKGNFSYRDSNDVYGYDPEKAQELLAEAGYPEGFSMALSYPTAGSGNMQPQAMNEALQRDLAAVGIEVELEPVEWATMISSHHAGKIPGDADAINFAVSFDPPTFWRIFLGPGSPINLAKYDNSEVVSLVDQAELTLDQDGRGDIYASVAELVTADAPWLFVVSDLNSRVVAPHVKGFVQPQSWFVDLTTVSVE